MDHEWFTAPLDDAQQGWDWFSIQLDSGVELMLFQIRHKDGSIDPFSAGTYIARDGRAAHLARADFSLTPTAWWTSPQSHARYPIAWHISVPAHNLKLDCTAAFNQQELAGDGASIPTYWEGAVDYSGSARGVGYLEMTGYAGALHL